jgi:hypothetical protein
MKQIHIVGCGQVGSILSKFLIKKGYSIKVYSPINNHDCQNPWGWVRRITLNQDERISKFVGKKLITMNKKYRKQGPMIISTSCNKRKGIWDSWITNRPKSDAKILNQDEAIYYNVTQGKHHLLCDSKDFLFDFGKQKQENIQYIQKKIDNNFINDDIVGILEKNKKIIKLQGMETNYPIEKDDVVIFCMGNQTNLLFQVPIMGVRLAYLTVKNKSKSMYLANWSDHSSIQYFEEYTKIGCGMNGSLDFLPPILYWYRYLPFLKKNNYSNFTNMKLQMIQACKERGIEFPDDYSSCTVDITPNFLPYLKHTHENSIVICGMSGSVFTAYELFFLEHILKMIGGEKKSIFTEKSVKSYLY